MSIGILILDDERAVREALMRDLAPFGDRVRIEAAEDVADAANVMRDFARQNIRLALVLADHRLPGTSGIDFLVRLRQTPATRSARTVLVTGQASHADTIRAINEADIDRYLAKPWDGPELQALVRTLLTRYVLSEGIDPLPLWSALDAPAVLESLGSRADH